MTLLLQSLSNTGLIRPGCSITVSIHKGTQSGGFICLSVYHSHLSALITINFVAKNDNKAIDSTCHTLRHYYLV